jgi:RHH-type proline utilization regulon transcriptional repressor/proline dehydrogenase/delta 1-pyrroline-5-carboxylate dehydrogenase
MDLEDRIRAVGVPLVAALRRGRPQPLTMAWAQDWGLEATAAVPRAQHALFTLIDCLPVLRRPEALGRAMAGLLEPVHAELPLPLRWALAVQRRGWVPAGLTLSAADTAVALLASRFLIGDGPHAIDRLCGDLGHLGCQVTLDWLGETVLTEAEADRYAAHCRNLIDRLAAACHRLPVPPARGVAAPRCNVSLKLSALTSRFEPADPVGTARRVSARLEPLLQRAREVGALINVDMEHHRFKDTTLHIVGDLLRDPTWSRGPELGIAVQAYLRSWPEDLAGMLAAAEHRPLWVRLVKGAYWDHETALAANRGWPSPVWSTKGETDAAYEAATTWLLQRHTVLRPCFAGHNARSIAHAIARREALGIPAAATEFQVLHGMAVPLARALVERGERVRCYGPVGELLPGMAYLVRRLLENGSNQGFLRQTAAGATAGRLLAAPALAADRPPVEDTHNSHGPSLGCEKMTTVPPDDQTTGRSTPTLRPPTEPVMFANCPLVDDSDPSVRAAQRAAYAAWSAPGEVPAVINGLATTSDTWSEVRDPSHRHQVLGMVCASTAEHATAAVDAAARFAPEWRAAGWSTRIACLRRAGDVLEQRRHAFAARLVREVGKTWREADGEVAEAVDFCRYYAERAQCLAAGTAVDVPGEVNDTRWEPRGVAVVIAPWNFPLAILAGMTVAALVTGNPVVMKPAEQSPLVARALFDLLMEAGVPAGALHFLPGIGEEVGPALVGHPATAVIAFTGSRSVGLGLVESAAQRLDGRHHIVRVVAELGGKNAILVDESADLDEAVVGIMTSAFGYQGQKCSACSRVIAHPAVGAALAKRLAEAIHDLEPAAAEDPRHGLGPVIDGEAQDRLERAAARFDAAYPRLAHGTVRPHAEHGWWVAPCLWQVDDPHSEIAQEEQFGPFLALLTAPDAASMVTWANGTRYALTGGGFAREPGVLATWRDQLQVGNLYLNRGITGALVHRQPFGGYRLSGIGGKAGGPDYLTQFCWARTITEHTMRHGMVGGRR